MRTSVRWINDYLGSPATAQEQAEALTSVGLNFDGRGTAPDGSIWQDIETTSNRGDCLCHFGLARELAAKTRRELVKPRIDFDGVKKAASSKDSTPAAGHCSDHLRVSNEDHQACPRYSARVLRGVRVGPSPQWLQDRLRDVGLIPRNNIVDCTNFVLLELGQPTHVFDLAKLNGGQIQVRRAREKEKFLPIGDQAAAIALTAQDLVIADASAPIALAGVKGGALSAVGEDTKDIVIEAATFHPSQVRSSSRRHNIASDSSRRFERGVHAGSIDAAAERLVELIINTAGGSLCEGALEAGAPIPALKNIHMRCDRCRKVLGTDITDQEMLESLRTLGFAPRKVAAGIDCTIPPERLDIEREIDVIEEVVRLVGLERVPMNETINIRTAAPDSGVEATERLRDTLVGMDFLECVTHSLISEKAAGAFTHGQIGALRIDDERAGATPCLRPSILPGLLSTRKLNEDRGAGPVGRLFEIASIFHLDPEKRHHESISLGMIADSQKDDIGYRGLRGVVERLVHEMAARRVSFTPTPSDEVMGPSARIEIDGQLIGRIGFLTSAVRGAFEMETPIIAAEISLDALLSHWPPERPAAMLPSMPCVERDLSLILDNSSTWELVERTVLEHRPAHFESLSFTGIYKGKQIGAGKKSLTLRMVFRDPERTLRREEVDLQVQELVNVLRSKLGAELRA